MNFDQVLELVKTVSDSDLTTFQYEEGNQKIIMHTGEVLPGSCIAEAGMPLESGNRGKAAESGSHDLFNGVSQGKAADAPGSTGGNITGNITDNTSGNVVTSPLVGRFYTAPSEEAENYVKVGDHVKKGQVLAIVEAMKLMNEIESEYDGVVTEILADNGQGVEYGQPLFCIA